MMTESDERKTQLFDELMDLVAVEGAVQRDVLVADALLSDIDMQSADLMMVLLAVEEKYDLYLSVDQSVTDTKTVGDLVSLIVQRILDQEKAGSPT